jgi:hypothetical protein
MEQEAKLMRSKMKALLISTLLLAWPSAAAAADFSNVDLQPYLSVSSKQLYGTLIPPTEETTEDRQQFISRGGAVVATLVVRDDLGFSATRLYRAVATPSQLAVLRGRLNARKIRGQRSCRFVTEGVDARFDFSWYAPRGKRNSFTIVLAKVGASELPPCRPDAGELVNAVSDFESEVIANADTEILSSP